MTEFRPRGQRGAALGAGCSQGGTAIEAKLGLQGIGGLAVGTAHFGESSLQGRRAPRANQRQQNGPQSSLPAVDDGDRYCCCFIIAHLRAAMWYAAYRARLLRS